MGATSRTWTRARPPIRPATSLASTAVSSSATRTATRWRSSTWGRADRRRYDPRRRRRCRTLRELVAQVFVAGQDLAHVSDPPGAAGRHVEDWRRPHVVGRDRPVGAVEHVLELAQIADADPDIGQRVP